MNRIKRIRIQNQKFLLAEAKLSEILSILSKKSPLRLCGKKNISFGRGTRLRAYGAATSAKATAARKACAAPRRALFHFSNIPLSHSARYSFVYSRGPGRWACAFFSCYLPCTSMNEYNPRHDFD